MINQMSGAKVDTIERTISVVSPIQTVWEALTVAEQLKQWFGDIAEIDLRPGGAMRVGWTEYDSVSDGVVEEVDEPSLFSYRWSAGETEDGEAWTTKVTFTLSESAGTTTVTVLESGFSELPEELYDRTLEENSSGWTAEMADLKELVEGPGSR